MRLDTSLIAVVTVLGAAALAAKPQAARATCPPGAAPMILPAGFCATLFADSVPQARHMAVAPNGDVFVAALGAGRSGTGGGIIALRDTKHAGKADVRVQIGTFRSSEVRLFEGSLYAENGSGVVRFPMKTGSLEPSGPPDTIVSGLPPGGNHPYKTFAIDKDGVLYVNVGTATNVCQAADRSMQKGVDPCVEVETRGGIWKFDARRKGQTPATGEHFARGIRNSVGMDINPADNALWVMQHGRDQLDIWPMYSHEQNAESPAEQLFHVARGDDMGWPYCYFDTELKAELLAPEYGGDHKTVGRCADKRPHVAAFPAHWAPNGLLFYRGNAFPAKYRNGVFIAFHGSWNRAPLPQQGTGVIFQPLANGRAGGSYEIFADGFRDTNVKPPALGGRPTGLAEGPDGALYVADDAGNRIWRITYIGGR
jgi:glucose/arabinose dehydrogenase